MGACFCIFQSCVVSETVKCIVGSSAMCFLCLKDLTILYMLSDSFVGKHIFRCFFMISRNAHIRAALKKEL